MAQLGVFSINVFVLYSVNLAVFPGKKWFRKAADSRLFWMFEGENQMFIRHDERGDS